MLVQCPDCTTKYNLDESRIGHDGSKVRCSRCKNVFTVFRPISEEAPVAHLDEVKPAAAPKSSVDEEMLADLRGAFQQPLTGPLAHDSLAHEGACFTKPEKSGSMGLIIGFIVLLLACVAGGIYFLKPGVLGLGPTVPVAPAVAPEAVAREGAARISLENVRQYFVPNEKVGQLFIIEGKAVNRFPEARELIRLRASLFDKRGAEVATQEFMCGNVVSLYQLQVSTRADIEAALSAKVGILTNNTNIQSGASVPFMAVFFQTPESVEEFGLEVIQSSVPQQ
jgi:predicted Zn finger-like uncharacterized protein